MLALPALTEVWHSVSPSVNCSYYPCLTRTAAEVTKSLDLRVAARLAQGWSLMTSIFPSLPRSACANNKKSSLLSTWPAGHSSSS